MYFLVITTDRPGLLGDRLKYRQEHLDYWEQRPGVVKVAGAILAADRSDADPKGSAFIIEADSLDHARELLASDPFTIRGVFEAVLRIETVRLAIGDWFPR